MEVMKDLTALIAAHGIYALSVIFIFYQQRRAYQNLRDASEGHDREYFRRVHVSVIAATYILVFLSTGVWFYATFMYQPVRLIKGEVNGLAKPIDAVDAQAIIKQQLAPERVGDVDFYPVDDVPSLTGEYRFRWVLLARENLRQIAFRFVQESATQAEVHLGPELAGNDPSGASNRTRKRSYLEKRFVLDLDALHYSPTRAIYLTYKPDQSDPSRVGSLWLSNQDGSIAEVKWIDSADRNQPQSLAAHLLTTLATTVFAAANASVFNADGSYSAEVARGLLLQLGSGELRTRLNARQLLVQSGSSAFRFVVDVLDRKIVASSGDWALLLDNLSKAVDDIELRGAKFSSDGHFKLAVALYNASDYRSAALHFDKAPETMARREPPQVAMRAHAYLETERFAEAVSLLNEYVDADVPSKDRAWARNALGWIYARTGRWEEAVKEKREALRLAPGSAQYLNGLAYTYAKQGTNLPEALMMIDRALRVSPDDPAFLETRGYILFRMGRLDEALDLIRKASLKLPDDVETQEDLKEVEAAAARLAKRGAPRASKS